MKKKILYGIFFVSIFLLSTATMVQPVRGYEWGVPKEAIGVTSNGEVKLYDEDEWEKHFGTHGSEPDDLFGGDADVVGAQDQSKYKEMETDEKLIGFLGDYLLENGLPATVAAGLGTTKKLNYKDVLDITSWLILGLSNDTAAKTALYTKYGVELAEFIAILEMGFGMIAAGYVGLGPWDADLLAAAADASILQSYAEQGSYNTSYMMAKYAKKYDGSILTRDKWDFDEDKEFKADKADDKDDEVPYMADPRDWFDATKGLEDYRIDINWRVGRLTAQAATTWASFNHTLSAVAPAGLGQWDPIPPIYPGHPYKTANDTIASLSSLLIALGVPRNLTAINPYIPMGTNNGVYVDIPYGIYLYTIGVIDAIQQIMDGILFGKHGTFWIYMVLGLPTYTPTADYLARAIKEFRFDEDIVEYNVPYLPTGVGVSLDISLDGMDVVIDFEYNPEDPLDKTDPLDLEPDELEDFTVIFRYGDIGSQSEVIFMAGGTEFYKKGGVDQIPGFEVTVILGVSAVSIIGLIYVIMKKRKM